MKRPLVVQFLSGLLNIIVCLISILIILYIHHWFGRDDVQAVVFWTIPMAIALAISGRQLIGFLAPFEHRAIRVVCIAVIATVLSYIWIHFVYLFHDSWTHAFGFPVFYLWIIAIFSQLLFLDSVRLQVQVKSSLTIIIFPFVLFTSVLATYAISTSWHYLTRHQKETFLIPASYSGTFRVVYGQKCGTEPRIENDQRILEIPSNGILLITSSFKTGIVDHEYYFVDGDGNRTRLSELQTPDSTGVWMKKAAILPGPMRDGSMSTESPLAIHYTDFVVVNTNLSPVTLDGDDEALNSKTFASVGPCRQEQSAYSTAQYRRPIYYFRMR